MSFDKFIKSNKNLSLNDHKMNDFFQRKSSV